MFHFIACFIKIFWLKLCINTLNKIGTACGEYDMGKKKLEKLSLSGLSNDVETF